MADLRISELAALSGVNLSGGDLLPVVDTSAGETKKITVLDAIGYGITLINDASIPGAKIVFNAGTLNGSALVTGTVDTAQLANNGVTAAKLADESTVDLVTTLPASGAYLGQLALDTDDDTLYCWTGSVWDSIKAAGSINTIVGSTAGIVNLSVATSGDIVTITASLDNTSGAAQFLAGPTATGGVVSYRQIASGDLPTASSSGKGGVSVNGSGLAMSGEQIVIDNTVAASGATFGVVQYNNKGLVTTGRAITSADLPAATSVDKGAVTPGTGLAAGVAGALNHSNSVTAGTAAKVTYDAQGHVTAGQALTDADIPLLSAGKITSGTLSANVIGTKSVTGAKLADSSTVQFGGASSTEGVVTFPTADFKGQQFFDALNGDLYLYDGAAWQPITITAGELIYAGTYNAGTNKVKSVTAAGTAAGLVVGNALPAASTSNLRYYVVVSDSGTGTAPAPAVALAPPDMLVSGGSSWELIDVSNAIAGQLASNISFTPSGNISSTNVQAAIQELDNEKLSGGGGTITGALEIGTTGSLVFEGSTADAWETTLAVVDPTADRTITLPNVTGTVITTGDTGTVTSAMLAGSLADSKLDTISTANKVNVSAIDIDGATDIGTSLADVDLFLVDDGGAGTNRKAAATRITDYAFGKVSGDVTIASNGTAAIGSDVIVNADVNASAAIAGTKISPDFGSQTVTTTGQVLTGTSTALTNVYAIATALTPAVQIQGNTANGAALSITRQTSAAANLLLQRGVTGTPVVDTDAVGQIGFNGFDGTNYYNAALIRGIVEGTPGTGSMPGRLSLQTTPTGSTTPVERLRLDAAGQILSASLGTVSLPVWSFTGDPNTGIWSPGADQVAVATGGTERIRIGASGQIGLSGANYGTSGQVLTSGGSGAAPTWTTISGGGGGDVFLANANAFTGANTFTNTTGQIFRPAATQDGILLRGRAGGTLSRTVEIIPTTLTASRVLTAPDVSGTIVTTGDTGSVTSTMIADGTIANVDINVSAAIAYTKLASMTAGSVLLGSATNVPTVTALTGDVTVNSTGVTSIGAGVVVDADISASAAIAYSKLASLTSGNILVGNVSNVATSVAMSGDVTISNAGVTAIGAGVIVNADINASAAIADSKLTGTTCKAWANFNGTAATSPFTIANGGMRGAAGISSVTDNGVGDYTLNFSSALATANYAFLGTAASTTVNGSRTVTGGTAPYSQSTTALRFIVRTEGGGAADADYISVGIFY